jgi:4a-hydroxytetrahydrobiopterin dehydratase
MTTEISPAQFHARTDLPDWRVVLGRIEAAFRLPTFDSAAALVGRIASAAEAAGHHPDLDLRYPGDVHVKLTTHDTGSLTEAEASLDRTIQTMS